MLLWTVSPEIENHFFEEKRFTNATRQRIQNEFPDLEAKATNNSFTNWNDVQKQKIDGGRNSLGPLFPLYGRSVRP